MWYQLFKALIVLSFSLGFLYGMIRVATHILTIPPYLRKPDDPNVTTLLITTGLLGTISVILMILAPKIPLYTNYIWYIGIGIYILTFSTIFVFGRLLRKPNNPSKPLSPLNTGIGVFAAFIPFLLLLVSGNQIFQEVLYTDEDTLMYPFIQFLILGIPAIVGVYGSGMFGKMSP